MSFTFIINTLVNCVTYRIFGHKTRCVWYVNKHITSHGSVYSSDTRDPCGV